MDNFQVAICEHNPLYKEGLQDKYYQGAKWAWQSRQPEVDELNQLYLKAQHQEVRHRTIAQDALALVEEKDKRITELEKTEFALAKVKQILNKHIKTRLLESIIVRELIDLLFSNKG